SAFEVEIDFGEVVSGFDTGDFSLSSGSVESLSDEGDGRYTARIGQVADGVFTLNLAVGAATDDAGNQSLAAVQFTRQVDASFASPE
ncbi:MAG: Ig-like domain-containing protein, partial [Rubripirellula sp.]